MWMWYSVPRSSNNYTPPPVPLSLSCTEVMKTPSTMFIMICPTPGARPRQRSWCWRPMAIRYLLTHHISYKDVVITHTDKLTHFYLMDIWKIRGIVAFKCTLINSLIQIGNPFMNHNHILILSLWLNCSKRYRRTQIYYSNSLQKMVWSLWCK
jgi:hypothetical protein